MGREELKWRQLAHNHLISQQGPQFSPHSNAKAKIKAQISGRMLSSSTSDVAFASVYSEKTRMKKCLIMIIMIIMNKSQETTVSGGRAPQIDFHYETKARKVMVDFKFDALYRQVFI